MDIGILLVLFILGTVIGSFLNVVICRLPQNLSLVSPPSHCPQCKERLLWLDLIPLFSYVTISGQCRYCRKPIPIRYFWVELVNGIAYLTIGYQMSLTVSAIAYMVLFSILLVVIFIDLDTMLIPDELMLFGFVAGILLTAGQSWTTFVNGIMGLLTGGGILLAIAILSKGGMGGGDIKLAGVIGLFLGKTQILLVLFLSFLIGASVGIYLLITKRKTMKDMIPFGPSLAVAGYIAMFWGPPLISWYLRIYS
ncbi:prepilin peptidase [Heliobacterium chlorum]|uniref:Prepilin leader peptidase/N-methyltransferase n=1 Tax=Heliobacterium chlorum TaxID=2698 RepID=A0ABR7T4E9_HELCL|nr:A24 family peptidase [Heliobacterium chlorum]MBC9784957.1 prepilin peptidase [Heliobacterium chlorum]